MNSLELFKCLSDKSRLKIINSLMLEPMYVELISERLGIATSTVSFHLKKLMEAGIVSSKKEQYYTVYALNKEIFSLTLESLVKDDRREDDLHREREESYRQKVIDSFFKYNKLKEIPVQKKKKQIILEEIVRAFEVGKEYTEREVNIIIADFHDDFCTLRRDLVGFGLMDRKDSIYIRR